MGGCQEWDTHARPHARKRMGTIRHGNLWGQFVTEINGDNSLRKTKVFRNELS